MRNNLLYISDKIDILDDRLDGVEKLLALQEHNLALHMKRSDMLEAQIAPLNKFMYAAYGIISFLLFAATVAGLIQFLK